jgi:hypothetical protein
MDTLADPQKLMAQMTGMSGAGLEAMQAMMMAAMTGKKSG